jgi:hypothetical protein
MAISLRMAPVSLSVPFLACAERVKKTSFFPFAEQIIIFSSSLNFRPTAFGDLHGVSVEHGIFVSLAYRLSQFLLKKAPIRIPASIYYHCIIKES